MFREKITVLTIFFRSASDISHNRDNFSHLPMLINTDVIPLNHSRLD